MKKHHFIVSIILLNLIFTIPMSIALTSRPAWAIQEGNSYGIIINSETSKSVTESISGNEAVGWEQNVSADEVFGDICTFNIMYIELDTPLIQADVDGLVSKLTTAGYQAEDTTTTINNLWGITVEMAVLYSKNISGNMFYGGILIKDLNRFAETYTTMFNCTSDSEQSNPARGILIAILLGFQTTIPGYDLILIGSLISIVSILFIVSKRSKN